MDKKTTFGGEPYRAAPALGLDKWNVYAEDDHGQDRYIGRVIKENGYFCIENAYSGERLEERVENFEEAIELLYALCNMSGYLTQGHENYLGRAEKKGGHRPSRGDETSSGGGDVRVVTAVTNTIVR